MIVDYPEHLSTDLNSHFQMAAKANLDGVIQFRERVSLFLQSDMSSKLINIWSTSITKMAVSRAGVRSSLWNVRVFQKNLCKFISLLSIA
jgi:hypothetical protein